jgi:hypothetical protein
MVMVSVWAFRGGPSTAWAQGDLIDCLWCWQIASLNSADFFFFFFQFWTGSTGLMQTMAEWRGLAVGIELVKDLK